MALVKYLCRHELLISTAITVEDLQAFLDVIKQKRFETFMSRYTDASRKYKTLDE